MGLICILRFGQDWLCVAPCLLNVLSEECKAIKRPVWVYLHNASSPCMACVSGGGGSGVITNQRQSGRTRNNNWEFTPKLWLVTGAISLSLSSAWLSHNECEWSDLFSKGHDWLDLFVLSFYQTYCILHFKELCTQNSIQYASNCMQKNILTAFLHFDILKKHKQRRHKIRHQPSSFFFILTRLESIDERTLVKYF